jgi:hypothetical protein
LGIHIEKSGGLSSPFLLSCVELQRGRYRGQISPKLTSYKLPKKASDVSRSQPIKIVFSLLPTYFVAAEGPSIQATKTEAVAVPIRLCNSGVSVLALFIPNSD